MKKWHITWEMDGCQWVMQKIWLYEDVVECPRGRHNGLYKTWEDSLKYIHLHLLDGASNVKYIEICCTEGIYKVPPGSISRVLHETQPEIFI